MMKRRLFNVAAAASLALCVATVTLGVRSQWRRDIIGYNAHGSHPGGRIDYFLGSERGGIYAGRMSWSDYPERYGFFAISAPLGEASNLALFDGRGGRRAGFGYMRHEDTTEASTGVLIPHWFLAVLLAIFPAARWSFNRLRESRNVARGRCWSCGYDLRATPDRCPECGGVPRPTP